jgi:D-glycero-alpha-D-manno-heptose-7-phosphate kinase
VNIAVWPGVEVAIRAAEGPDPVVFDVAAFDDRYALVPRAPRLARHPLLESAIDAFPPRADIPVEISVRSEVPAGCGTGTSAAVAVALIGGLTALRSQHLSKRVIAREAHRLEVDILGAQSGIQDQLSAALGGINYIEIETYPEAVVHPLPHWEELGRRLSLVFLGHGHDSSAVHRQVIENVASREPAEFSRLREAAAAGRRAVLDHDFAAFGRAMIANTQAQEALHPDLVGVEARRVIAGAAAHGAVGWKVNGAGGDGGSVSILSSTEEAKRVLEEQLAALDPGYRVLPIEISASGLEVRGDL